MSNTAIRKTRHNFKLIRACAAGLCLLLSYAAPGSAQEQSPQRGFNAGGSYAISDIETISTTGGNLSLRVPVGSLPAGRGGLAASVSLVYNSKLYDSYPSTQRVGGNDYEVTRLSKSSAGGGLGLRLQIHFGVRRALCRRPRRTGG